MFMINYLGGHFIFLQQVTPKPEQKRVESRGKGYCSLHLHQLDWSSKTTGFRLIVTLKKCDLIISR